MHNSFQSIKSSVFLLSLCEYYCFLQDVDSEFQDTLVDCLLSRISFLRESPEQSTRVLSVELYEQYLIISRSKIDLQYLLGFLETRKYEPFQNKLYLRVFETICTHILLNRMEENYSLILPFVKPFIF